MQQTDLGARAVVFLNVLPRLHDPQNLWPGKCQNVSVTLIRKSAGENPNPTPVGHIYEETLAFRSWGKKGMQAAVTFSLSSKGMARRTLAGRPVMAA